MHIVKLKKNEFDVWNSLVLKIVGICLLINQKLDLVIKV